MNIDTRAYLDNLEECALCQVTSLTEKTEQLLQEYASIVCVMHHPHVCQQGLFSMGNPVVRGLGFLKPHF